MHNPEQDLLEALTKSKKTLGPSVPRLVTQKPQVAMNATRHQLTGQSIFMPPAELADYLSLGGQIIEELEPVGVMEIQLVQRIVDTNWRLNRASALETIVFNTSIAVHSRSIYASNPGINEETVLIFAKGEAYREDCADVFEKLSRHEARLQRSMRLMRAEFEEMTERRRRKMGRKYDLATCPAYAWYTKLYDLAERLIGARQELADKSTDLRIGATENTPVDASSPAVTNPESTNSNEACFVKTALHLVSPLTPETEATFQQAFVDGLLTDAELTLFAQPVAA